MKRVSAQRVIGRILRPFQEFMQLEASSGILLLVCTAVALMWANSPWATVYTDLLHWELPLGIGGFTFAKSVLHWINDGLMAVFFLVVGLEIKREVVDGELASFRRAALPVAAAVGGMIIPAAVYVTVNWGGEGLGGWGIPMATDIAFALGALALMGNRVPLALKVFLTALAIVDDIGAVVVIALFYSSHISWVALGVVAVILGVLFLANRRGVRGLPLYALLGVALWLAMLESGIHATLAGVLVAATIPASGGSDGSPLYTLEHALHPWVTFLIMPLFALANAGVAMQGNLSTAWLHPVSLGVIAGLVLGKQVGISLASWLAIRTGLAALPDGVTLRQIYGVSWLGGIGFTMSLFVASLAFGEDALLTSAKLGILTASLVAGCGGWLTLRRLGESVGSTG